MKKIGILIRKEMLDILRDKKTLIMMILVPIVLYPLLIIGMTLVLNSVMSTSEEVSYTVGFDGEYADVVADLQEVMAQDSEEFDEDVEFLAMDEGGSSAVLDATLRFETDSDGRLRAEITYDSTAMNSAHVCRMLEDAVEGYRQKLVVEGLAKLDLDEDFLHPIICTTVDEVSEAESFGVSIGGSIGMMLIVMILMGALYPAIDTTAGEKERGTLETLLTLPVTNFQMIFSKFVSVAIIACVTALLSLISLAGSVLFLIFGVAGDMVVEFGFSATAMVGALPMLFLTMLVTALLSSALCMCFCVFAKSFKEANNYVTPLLLVVMIASMAGMLPSVELDQRTVLIPIVNVSLMMKQVLSQQFSFVLAGVANLVNLCVSILIIWFLAKMYDSENILFADGFRSFRLFVRRSDVKKGTVPDNGDVMLAVTVLFLLMIYVGSAASARLGFWGTAVTQLMILAVPLLLVWYMKSDVKTLFSLNAPRKGTVLGSVLLYLGTYCLIMVLSVALMVLFPESMENVELAFSPIAEQPFVFILLVVALMPAVGEEFLFRGLMFGSIRANWLKRHPKEPAVKGAVYAILISAAVFGVFHMSLAKFFTTFLLGALFAYIVYRTGSIYVTMGLHFVNNAVSMAVMKYPEAVGKVLPFLMEEELSMVEIVGLLAAGVVLAGLGFMLLGKKKE
ncbi:MAG: CPBP family intramembrane metalloprotease [Ruminococcus sp.]|nr:CPBP family intramembrane metalloprotease [Ruminococcus sp.]